MALVTGGSRGIGAVRSRSNSPRAGASVTLSYRSAKDEAEEVAARSGRARAVQVDVADAEEAKRLVAEAGDLFILVDNAGHHPRRRDRPYVRLGYWNDVIGTNLGGVFYTCRAAARGMMRNARARS